MQFRRSAALFVLASVGVVSGFADADVSPDSPDLAGAIPASERDFLSRVRRLTIEGRRAGEGYWSKDGKQLVFQSEREPGNPFYQIYLMDMETGNTTRVSPGTGKTTCAFINPATGDILFASTHHDPRSKQLQDDELKFRASGQERRYSWDYDPEMELYVRNTKTGALSAAHEPARLRRGSELLARRPVDRLLLDARRLRSRAVGRGTEAARDGSELLRRDLHHARRRRRIGPAAADERDRL